MKNCQESKVFHWSIWLKISAMSFESEYSVWLDTTFLKNCWMGWMHRYYIFDGFCWNVWLHLNFVLHVISVWSMSIQMGIATLQRFNVVIIIIIIKHKYHYYFVITIILITINNSLYYYVAIMLCCRHKYSIIARVGIRGFPK